MTFLRMRTVVEGGANNIYVLGQVIIFLAVTIEFFLYKTFNFIILYIFKNRTKFTKATLKLYFIQFTRFCVTVSQK